MTINKGERFDKKATALPETEIKTEPGSRLDIPFSDLETFQKKAFEYSENYQKIKELEKEQKEKKKEIVSLVKSNRGLRGIISGKENFSLTVFPSEKTSWDREKLKDSLGMLYSVVAKEIATISITIPYEEMQFEGIIEETIKKILMDLGIKENELDKLVQKKIETEVNEKELKEFVSKNGIDLPKKIKKTKTTWKIRVSPIKS
jgi:carbamoylphosphate synthase small subunit